MLRIRGPQTRKSICAFCTSRRGGGSSTSCLIKARLLSTTPNNFKNGKKDSLSWGAGAGTSGGWDTPSWGTPTTAESGLTVAEKKLRQDRLDALNGSSNPNITAVQSSTNPNITDSPPTRTSRRPMASADFRVRSDRSSSVANTTSSRAPSSTPKISESASPRAVNYTAHPSSAVHDFKLRKAQSEGWSLRRQRERPSRSSQSHGAHGQQWDCPSCNTTNLARKTNCSRCSTVRPPLEGYQPDWHCSNCRTSNFAKRTTCFGCSSPRPAPSSGVENGQAAAHSAVNEQNSFRSQWRAIPAEDQQSTPERRFRDRLSESFSVNSNATLPSMEIESTDLTATTTQTEQSQSSPGIESAEDLDTAQIDTEASGEGELVERSHVSVRPRRGRTAEFDYGDEFEDETSSSRLEKGHGKQKKSRRSGGKGRDAREDEDGYDDYERAPRKPKEKKKKRKEPKLASVEPTPVYLPEFISVVNLATVLKLRPDEFLRTLEDMGFEGATYDHILDSETAGLIAVEYNFEPIFETGEERDLIARPAPEDPSSLPIRPPVVTIMGHVDHGKTTILDWLRKSSVAASEHGGITQHIGAFSVKMPSGKIITFLDTPGHAAFLDMRRRGANVTDIVILVVAADDSVKPQTLEAIKHAREAGVPMIVAMNKIDKEGANVEKVKLDLATNGVEVEDIGGDVQAIPLSGKTGQGMVQLEEAIITLSELLDHRAEVDGPSEGWIIEASTKKGGRTATMLVKRGTMRVGDYIVAGTAWARIRTLRNEAGISVQEASPGTPIEVDGWREDPSAGDEVLQAEDEQHARSVIEYRQERVETKKLSEDIEAINEQRRSESEKRAREEAAESGESASETPTVAGAVNFIIKADVSGSAEAIVNSVVAVGNNEAHAAVLRSSVGPISEFDVDHAAVAKGYIINFNQAVEPHIARKAELAKVPILSHNIIYNLVNDVKDKVSAALPPLKTTKVSGEAEIGHVFSINTRGRKFVKVAGCRIRNGVIERNSKVRVLRDDKLIYEGTIVSLKNVKKDVNEMRKGSECGVGFSEWEDFEVGDEIQTITEIVEKRTL